MRSSSVGDNLSLTEIKVSWDDISTTDKLSAVEE